MKTYRMKVPFAGFVEVTVEADFPAEAEEKFCLMNLEENFSFHDSRVEIYDLLFLDEMRKKRKPCYPLEKKTITELPEKNKCANCMYYDRKCKNSDGKKSHATPDWPQVEPDNFCCRHCLLF